MFLIFKPSHLTLVSKLKFLYKCTHLNSKLWIPIQVRILENFPDFSCKVWTPLKFKFDSILKFITWIMLGIWSPPNWESCSNYSNLVSSKVWIFLEQGKVGLCNLQFWACLNNWENQFLPGAGPAHWSSSDPVGLNDCGPPVNDPPVPLFRGITHPAHRSVPTGPRHRHRFVWARSAMSDSLRASGYKSTRPRRWNPHSRLYFHPPPSSSASSAHRWLAIAPTRQLWFLWLL
jgi:hypothetical protein